MNRWKTICCLLLMHGTVIAADTLPAASALSLKAAVDAALERNHDIRLSALAIRSAEAATVIAGAAPNPTLTVQSISINPRRGIGPGGLRDKNLDSTVRIDQVIERGGKRQLRTDTASRLEDASRLDLSDTRRQLRLLVANAYYDLLAAQDRLATANETIALFDSTLAAAQKRKKAGDIAGADVERIQVDALRARNDYRQAEADLAKAQLALALLLDMRSSTETLRASDPWPAPDQADISSDLEALIDQRPDIKAARARTDAALSGRALALASRTRDVSVGAQFEHVPGSDVNNTWGISVQIPLFTRYYYDGEIRSAEAALDTARENLEKARGVARNEIYASLQDVRAAMDRARRFQQELLVAARKSADAAEYGFKNGAIGAMDVLDARRIYRLTQFDAVTAQADYAKALAAWRAAVNEEDKK
jgi:cobalt-zinc-cadmium efflux system outer membrane protein